MVPNGSAWNGGRKGEAFRSWRRDQVRKSIRQVAEELHEAGKLTHYSLGTIEFMLSQIERGVRMNNFKDATFDTRQDYWNAVCKVFYKQGFRPNKR